MKKRLLAAILCVFTLAATLSVLACCKDKDAADDYSIVYGKKYVLSDDVREEIAAQKYYIFYRNGTCKFRFYYKQTELGVTVTMDLTVDFRFLFADRDNSSVVLFYDGMTDDSTYVDAGGNVKPLSELEQYQSILKEYVQTDLCELVTVSKNVLCTVGTGGYNFYINEDYVKNLPNFGVDSEEKD